MTHSGCIFQCDFYPPESKMISGMKRERNRFTEMMRGFWNNQDLKVPDLACKGTQDHGEMTAEDYRQRMIQAFHNADEDELIAVCVPPTEKEFEHLELLLKNHYKR